MWLSLILGLDSNFAVENAIIFGKCTRKCN